MTTSRADIVAATQKTADVRSGLVKWNHLSEGEMGDAFNEMRCCICGSRLPDGLAWFPRDVTEQEATLLIARVKYFDLSSQEIDAEALAFCSECKSNPLI